MSDLRDLLDEMARLAKGNDPTATKVATYKFLDALVTHIDALEYARNLEKAPAPAAPTPVSVYKPKATPRSGNGRRRA